MWYNAEVLTDFQPYTEVELLWHIYQLLLNATTLFFAFVISFLVFKFLLWFLPNYWNKGKA